MKPALFINGNNAMQINKDEVFGPITCVIKADDYDHALDLANDTEFGLTSSIITRSLSHASHFRKTFKIRLRDGQPADLGNRLSCAFGGRKNSSFGSREQGQYAAEFYTQVKTTYLKA